MRILVVEDYAPLRTSLDKGLRESGFAVDCVADGLEALEYVDSEDYDVVVLDLMLPGMDGLSILERIRSRGLGSRVLILTAKDQVEDRVKGLDLGADDYLTKPFSFDELTARIRVLLRRKYDHGSPVIRVDDLEINTSARTVHRSGKRIELTAREYGILEVLAFRPGEIVTRDEIWNRIYDFRDERGSNVIDVYVGYLRKKLEAFGGPRLVHTRRGLGYVLDDESA